MNNLFIVPGIDGEVDLRECTPEVRAQWRNEAILAHDLATLAALDDIDDDRVHAIPVDEGRAREWQKLGQRWFEGALYAAERSAKRGHQYHFVRMDGTANQVAKFLKEARDGGYGLYPLDA